MINELTYSKNAFDIYPGIFNKNGKEKKYRLKVSVILEKDGHIEDSKYYSIDLEEYEKLFFSTICKLNEDEILRFKESRKFIGRV